MARAPSSGGLRPCRGPAPCPRCRWARSPVWSPPWRWAAPHEPTAYRRRSVRRPFTIATASSARRTRSARPPFTTLMADLGCRKGSGTSPSIAARCSPRPASRWARTLTGSGSSAHLVEPGRVHRASEGSCREGGGEERAPSSEGSRPCRNLVPCLRHPWRSKRAARRRNSPPPGAWGSLNTRTLRGYIPSPSGSFPDSVQSPESQQVMGPDGSPFAHFPG